MYSVANDAYLRMTPRGWLWTEWETISVTVISIIAVVVVKDILALSCLCHRNGVCAGSTQLGPFQLSHHTGPLGS